MKRLKILILALGLIMAQGALAVTLPTTSYSPYSTSEITYDGMDATGVQFSSMKFSALGSSEWGDACVAESGGVGNISACQSCCERKFYECCPNGECEDEEYEQCKQLSRDCNNECGRSLPLDGGEWVLLTLLAMAMVGRIVCSMIKSKQRLLEKV